MPTVKKKFFQKPTPYCDASFEKIKEELGYMLEKLFLFGCSQEEIQKIEKATKWKRLWKKLIQKIGFDK
jgi:uncharacterized FlgJ-related protein